MIIEEFKPYQPKPVTRYAYQITEHDAMAKMGKATYNIVLASSVVAFKAYEKPQVGDFIVYTADDIYHCSEATFRERNVVED
jgi:hypothetical protein